MNELEVKMKKKKNKAVTRFDGLHENNKMMIVRRKIVKDIRHCEKWTETEKKRKKRRAECVSDVYFNVNAV